MLKPQEVFIIKKNEIYSKYECQITIDEKEYNETTLTEMADRFIIPGILEFYFPKFDDYCQIVLNYDVDLLKNESIEEDKNLITIHYHEKELLITKDYFSGETNMGLLDKLMQGNVKYINDYKIIVNMLHDILRSIDLVHIELIVSNMFRKKEDLNEKCRIKGNYKDSVILGVRKQPHQDSWQSALAFQYIDKAIQKGLVEGKDTELNPIEKVLNEDFEGL